MYTSQEKEYKQAKLHAAQTLGIRLLPSNAQIAHELDILADEIEGSARKEKLLQMRREALQIMKTLDDLHPRLIGSVWRGTARRGSDIDIVAFSSKPKEVSSLLQNQGFQVVKTEWQSAPKLSRRERSLHIFLQLSSGDQVEVVVRSLERLNAKEKDETYGDTVTGLNTNQLDKAIAEDPFARFVPRKNYG